MLVLALGLRISVVSPTLLTESQENYGAFFCGFETVPAAKVARAFSKSVEGNGADLQRIVSHE